MWNSDLYVLDAVFRMVGDLFSREGRRNLAWGACLLLSFALAMVGVAYLVYGRGPQCVVKVGKPCRTLQSIGIGRLRIASCGCGLPRRSRRKCRTAVEPNAGRLGL